MSPPDGAEAVRRIVGMAEEVTPEPPPSPPRPWPTLDPVALYGLPGDVVRAIEPHTEAGAVAHLAQCMLGAGNTIVLGTHKMVEGGGL